jgi:hypothetical protein
MPKQPRFDKRSAATPGKKPGARTRPVWLLLGLATVLLATMTRKAYGYPSPRQTNGPPSNAAGRCMLAGIPRAGLAAASAR